MVAIMMKICQFVTMIYMSSKKIYYRGNYLPQDKLETSLVCVLVVVHCLLYVFLINTALPVAL